MDTAWAFRQAYEKARQIKQAQDDFCAKAKKGEWTGLGDFPEELQWEALVDVLRGRVKVGVLTRLAEPHIHDTTFPTGPDPLLRDR